MDNTLGQRQRSSRLQGGRLASFYLFRSRKSKNRCTSAPVYLFRSWQNELINYCAKVNDRKRGSAHGKAHCSFQIRAIGRLGSVWPDCSLTPLSLSSHSQSVHTGDNFLCTKHWSERFDRAVLSEAEGFRSIKLTVGDKYTTQRCIPLPRGCAWLLL